MIKTLKTYVIYTATKEFRIQCERIGFVTVRGRRTKINAYLNGEIIGQFKFEHVIGWSMEQ